MEFDVLIVLHVLAILNVISSTYANDYVMTTHSHAVHDYDYFQVIEPQEINYIYKLKPAKDFGSEMTESFVGIDLVITKPGHACGQIENKFFVKNNIAFVERGECSFLTKSLNAEEAGAEAIIIMDYEQDNDSRMVDMVTDGTDRRTAIPAFFMYGKDGFMIKKTLAARNLRSAIINIPINATGIPPHMLNMPPWSLW